MIQNIDNNTVYFHAWKELCEKKNLKVISLTVVDAYGNFSFITIPEMTNENISTMLKETLACYESKERVILEV